MNTSGPTILPDQTAKYIMETSEEEDFQVYRIYKNTEKGFKLVDCFTDFNQANDEAKSIIRQSKKFNHFSID